MVTSELRNYIKEASSSGMDEEDIITNLINVGWKVEDVDIAIKKELPVLREEKIKRFQKRVAPASLSIVFVIGLFMVGSTFYASSLFVTDMDKYFSVDMPASVHEAFSIAPENTKSTMLFVGDIMLSSGRGVGKQIKETGDYTFPFLKIANTLQSADFTFGNLEGPLSSRGKDSGGVYSFRADPKTALGLAFAGFDMLSVANNHIFDWGEDAFKDTIYILRSNGIDAVGGGMDYLNANKPLIKNIKDTKVAFFAYSMVDYDIGNFEATKDVSGKSSFNKKKLMEEIKRLKFSGDADIIVVSFHWGEEYKMRSHSKQQDLAYLMIDTGADLIIGHHPHVVQEVEKYKKGWIAYSLGNFVFDQNFSEETMRGLMLDVEIKNKKIDKVNPIEIKISETFQPYIE